MLKLACTASNVITKYIVDEIEWTAGYATTAQLRFNNKCNVTSQSKSACSRDRQRKFSCVSQRQMGDTEAKDK